MSHPIPSFNPPPIAAQNFGHFMNRFDQPHTPLPGGSALSYELPLDQFGAPGFTLRDRVDFSGHEKGTTYPHLNSELVNPYGNVIKRDLVNTQFPGFNNMQIG